MQGPTPGVTPSSRKQITGTALIVAALVVFMVVVAAVGLVFGGGEEPANPDGFLGYWRATEEAPDGGLWYMRIDQSGDGFLITDSMRAPDEPLAARLDDDVLGITYAEGQKKAYKETY